MDKLGKVKYIIVHHTQRERDFPEFINIRHTYKRGWDDIGYHYLIGNGKLFTRDGILYKGRDEKFVGAHALGYNRESIGVCMIGDFDKESPSARQLNTLFAFLKQKMKEYKVPAKNVLGHKELPGIDKTCPGLKVDMDWIRSMLR